METGDIQQGAPSAQEHLAKSRGFLRFEVGAHGDGSHQSEVKEKIRGGDLSKHVWNGAVFNRMQDYQPYVVGIDSLYPHLQNIDPLKNDYTVDEKVKLWSWLPNNPARINEKGEVLVVLGDIQYEDFEAAVPPQVSDEDFQEIHKTLSAAHDKQREMKSFTNERNLIVGTGLLMDSILFATYMFEHYKDKKISRRKFLMKGSELGIYGTAVAAGYLLSRYLGTGGAAYSPSEQMAGIAKKIAEFSKPLSSDEWLQGRNALLIAKTKEVAESPVVPKDSNASVVFGNAHIFGSDELLKSEKARAEEIRKLALPMMGVINKVNQEFPMFSPDVAQNIFLDLMSKSEYALVSNPDNKTNPDPVQNLVESVRYVGSKQCEEVVRALEPLRPNNFASAK